MIRMIIAFFLLLGAGTVLLSLFLSPDDLAGCGNLPGQSAKCQKADAIIAISGGNTNERAQEAIELYKLGWADTLVFSGAAKDTSGPSNAEVMRAQALEAGVPASSVLVETFSQTTKQNASKSVSMFEKNDFTNVILVTSPYHQRRASLEFHSVAGDTVTIRNHPTTHDDDWSAWWWLTPRGWWLAGGEVVKIIAFYTGQSE